MAEFYFYERLLGLLAHQMGEMGERGVQIVLGKLTGLSVRTMMDGNMLRKTGK